MPEVLGEINEMILRDAKERQEKENKDSDDSDNTSVGSDNSGTMIVDATCARSNIRYPQNVSLLNEARENAENFIDILHDPSDGKKPRTYRKCARKEYLKYAKCRKHTVKMTRKATEKQLNYLKRDLDGNIQRAPSRKGSDRSADRTFEYDPHRLRTAEIYVRQPDAQRSGSYRQHQSAFCTSDHPRQSRKTGGIWCKAGYQRCKWLDSNRENLSYCKERGIRLSGTTLGRPKKDEIRDKTQDYFDECERVEVERKFSLAKRKCGMGLITAKLRETAAHVIAMSILVLNLRKIRCALLRLCAILLDFSPSHLIEAFV